MEITEIHQKIYEVRGQKIMLDYDLAALYNVQTKVLNQAVKRNIKRFPSDFMFQLNKVEYENLRSQIVTSKENKHGGLRYIPFVFTEQGIAMLSGIRILLLKSILLLCELLFIFESLHYHITNYQPA